MQEASEQTGKLADSGRRFTDKEPRYNVHFGMIFLAPKNTELPFRLSLLSIDALQKILNKPVRNLSQNIRVLTMSNPGVNCVALRRLL